MCDQITLRAAQAGDAAGIAALLHKYALQGVLLDRSEDDILFYLKNFTVAVDKNNALLGCVAVRDFGNDLLEVRSLAVQPDARSGGIGRKLVEAAIEHLKAERKNFRLFALTLQEGFFVRLGFRIVEKELFPEKIWHDCANCPKRQCCDEIAVIYDEYGA